MTMFLKSFVVLSSALLLCGGAHSIEIPQAYKNVAKLHGIPEKVLYSIALAESGRDIEGSVIAWPWTLNVEGDGHYFDSRSNMLDFIAKEMLHGKRSIDVGALQINVRFHGARFEELVDISIPAVNLNVASEILMEQYINCDLDWWCAVGRYHSPGNKKLASRYRQRVKRWYEKL